MEFKKIFTSYWLSLVLFIISIGLVFFARSINDGWTGLGYLLMAIIFFFASIISFIILLIKEKLQFDMKWWMYPILIVIVFFIAVMLIRFLANVDLTFSWLGA